VNRKHVVKIALSTLAFLLLASLAAACSNGGVNQSDFDAAIADRNALELERSRLEAELVGVRGELQRAEHENGILIAENSSLASVRDEVAANLNSVSEEYDEFKLRMSVFANLSETEARNRLEEEQKREVIAGLDGEIAVKEAELDRLANIITRTGEEPIRLPAGHLYGGTDVPPGRYQVSNGSSNFIVHGANGRLMVNIILGGRLGVDSYIFTLGNGDAIQNNAPSTLTPIN